MKVIFLCLQKMMYLLDCQDANSPLIVDIERGDSLTFSVTGIAAETTGKLYANSLFILGTIIKIGKYGLIEVIE